MIEKDTVKLLRECDAGIQMGVSSIDDVLKYVHSQKLERELVTCKSDHQKLERDLREALDRFGDDGKEPNPMSKGMSWIKTNVMLAVNESDHTIADLMTDGCNMGVKSLSRYLNQYAAASEDAKDICKRLIKLEEDLAVALREYL